MPIDEPLEIDETALCYFAALIYGLSIIAEKELDRGMVPGTTPVDAEALIHFVRHKGDRLVHHMQTDQDRASKHHRILWKEDEIRAVVAECSRLFPAGTKLLRTHFEQAQLVLPHDRHRSGDGFNYTFIHKMRALFSKVAARPTNGSSPSESRIAVIKRTPVRPDPSPPVPAEEIEITADQNVASQIVTALLSANIKALRDAADQLERVRDSQSAP